MVVIELYEWHKVLTCECGSILQCGEHDMFYDEHDVMIQCPNCKVLIMLYDVEISNKMMKFEEWKEKTGYQE